MQFVIGVDVGTGSVRAGVFDRFGRRLGMASAPIALWKPQPDWAEQSSDDIWQAVGVSVRQAVAEAGVPPEAVAGVSFDATCSLVVLDRNGQPLTVSTEATPERNVLVWMDHRALVEAEWINAGGYDVLRYVGGKLSPEMEIPKLLWLKKNLPETWRRAGKFFDLADFLTWRCTGRDVRSLCTQVCKWTYLGAEGCWDHDFFDRIGLEDLFSDDKVVDDVRPMGERIGSLTAEAAQHLGLTTNTCIGVGIIDAHAGGLGVLGSVWEGQETPDLDRLEAALALIGGTSSCHMAVSQTERFISGVWGPYYSAMLPGLWLTEGGQSATGALIDATLENHCQGAALQRLAAESGQTVYQVLNAEVAKMALRDGLASPSLLTRHLHVLDYHLGNRSPSGDPRARGVIDGLGLDTSLESLALLYLAMIQSIAYGTRAIVDALNASGYQIRRLYAVGGGTKNSLWLQEHADIMGAEIVLPEEPEAVLLGSAILAAVAAGFYSDIPAAMHSMCRSAGVIHPHPQTAAFHNAKYQVYHSLYAEQKRHREIMESA